MKRRIHIEFTKMSGAGNDFVVIDNRRGILTSGVRDFVCAVASRRTGVGADGVLLIEKSRVADFRLRYYNADGSYGGFCGNGGRCIARYAFLHGIAPAQMAFDALGHVYHAKVDGRKVRLRMKQPKHEKLGIDLRVNGRRFKVHSVDTGSPHAVLFLEENEKALGRNLSSIDVIGIGQKVRKHRYFGKAGTNVNFVSLNRDASLSIRTYERGVEDETLACGTGSVASAIVASRVRELRSPVTVIPRSRQPLVVEFQTLGSRIRNVYLEGNADIIFTGVVVYDPAAKSIAC